MPLLKDFKTATHFGGVEDSSDKKKPQDICSVKSLLGISSGKGCQIFSFYQNESLNYTFVNFYN